MNRTFTDDEIDRFLAFVLEGDPRRAEYSNVYGMISQLKRERDEARSGGEADAPDAKRYRFLKSIYFGADFSWQNGDDKPCPVLVFKMYDGMRISANLDRSIDDNIALYVRETPAGDNPPADQDTRRNDA
ncbi:MAG TPA: hypothetical protein VF516_03115 [Kofleriaceae bacterium]